MRTGLASCAWLLVQAVALAAAKKRAPGEAAYLLALRSETGLGLKGGNLTVGRDRAHVNKAMVPSRLALVLPPRWVLTVSDALAGVPYINKAADRLPRTIPRHFVLSMWVLHTRYISTSSRDRLWRLWLEGLPPLDNATLFWSEDEVAALEEERAVQRSTSRRRQLQGEYDDMVNAVLENGMRDDLPDGVGEPRRRCAPRRAQPAPHRPQTAPPAPAPPCPRPRRTGPHASPQRSAPRSTFGR